MTRRFAEGTTVPTDKTRIEIEETLRRFGADGMMSGYEGRTAFVAFRHKGRFVRLKLQLPKRDDRAFTMTDAGKPRSANVAADLYEAEVRRRWRSLCLLIKAKLAAVADGIVAFEEEWMPHVVMPDGRTVFEHAQPAIDSAYETGQAPKMLPDFSNR